MAKLPGDSNADHLGDVIAYGEPLLRQKRNEHNLWQDLDAERVGMLITDEFCATLRRLSLRGTTFHDCYGELVEKLPSAWQPGPTWTDAMRAAREGLIEGMAVWHEVFRTAAKTEDDAPPNYQIAVHEGAEPEHMFHASAHAGSR